jgi:hypothetical protein
MWFWPPHVYEIVAAELGGSKLFEKGVAAYDTEAILPPTSILHNKYIETKLEHTSF